MSRTSPPAQTPAQTAAVTDRAAALARLADTPVWDLAVVGGGATGLGVALDGAARGLSVLLVDAGDFAGGTSSRATKLAHGGVRYLAQGRLGLVREALRERAALLGNAPHLVRPLPFVVPAWRRWERAWYGAGLVAYDALAGARSLGRTRLLDAAATRAALPGVRADGLRGGVLYWDAQFDDARLAIALARTAAAHGALMLNHCEATGLLRDGSGRVRGLGLREAFTGQRFDAHARCVVNATGVWVDGLRAADDPSRAPLVQPSQGLHLVLPRSFLPAEHALLVPRTADGRVLFVIPWMGHLVLGTTDTPRTDAPREPMPLPGERSFILSEAARVLARAPGPADVLSAWVGLRPLVRPARVDDTPDSKQVSREHLVEVAPDGLVSVTGGKWTTYRAMAQDVLDRVVRHRLLPALPPCPTERLALVGSPDGQALSDAPSPVALTAPPGEHLYGADMALLHRLPGAGHWLAPGLSEAMVRFAVRHEFAQRVEDVLARRSRLLLLNAAQAAAVAPGVDALMREEGVADPGLAPFLALADQYRRQGSEGSA